MNLSVLILAILLQSAFWPCSLQTFTSAEMLGALDLKIIQSRETVNTFFKPIE